MAYFPTENRLGLVGFGNVDTATAVPFGTIVRGADSASGKGGAEFIYLPGNAGVTAAGLLVSFIPGTAAATTLASNTANQGKPVAVSMAAVNATTKFGWFLKNGVAAVLKTAVKVSPNVKVFLSATSGRISGVAASGKEVMGAISVNAATVVSATSTVLVYLSAPFEEGQVI